jgi:hypothetical protein
MQFFNNNWEIFTHIEKLLSKLVDKKGIKLIDNGQIKKFEKKSKPKSFADIYQYFQFMGKIFDMIIPQNYTEIPNQFFNEFRTIKDNVSSALTSVRTARALYKKPNLFEQLNSDLNRLNTVCSSYINQMHQLWPNKKLADLSREELIEKDLQIPAKRDSEYLPQIWYDIEFIKKTKYKYNALAVSWLVKFPEGQILEEKIKQHQIRSKEIHFLISDMYTNQIVADSDTFKNQKFRLEIFYLLFQTSYFKLIKDRISTENELKDFISEQLETYINKLLQEQMQILAKKNNLQYEPTESPISQIPEFIMKIFETTQDVLTKKYDGDLAAANKKIQEFGENLIENVKILEAWIKSISPFLKKPWENILRKLRKMFSHIRADIERNLEEFVEYTDTVQEESIKSDLDNIIEDKILEMEKVLNSYETETSSLLKKEFPELDKIKAVILDYKKKVSEIKSQVSAVFEQFHEKEINTYVSVKNWEKSFETLQNRINFSIKTIGSYILYQFQDVIEEEHEFVQALKDLKTEDGMIPHYYMSDIIIPEKLSEQHIRERIFTISQKINQIEETKKAYGEEKQKYQELLKNYLKDVKHIVSKKCVICHKMVTISEDHFTKCEFCGVLCHYTCAVWWIEKYNSCPVCYNQYVVPNSNLYDPEQLDNTMN